jgi:transposase
MMPLVENMNTAPSAEQGGRFGLPWDVSQWIDKRRLLQWVTEEIEALDWTNAELITYLRAHPDYRPKILLTLLTYAYATGACESGEIVEGCYQDTILRKICGGEPPAPTAIARFRRENRGLLKWSLAQVFKRAFKTKFELDDAFFPAGLRRHVLDAAVARLDVARQLDRGASGA